MMQLYQHSNHFNLLFGRSSSNTTTSGIIFESFILSTRVSNTCMYYFISEK